MNKVYDEKAIAKKALKDHKLRDADFQAIKGAMRELGYIPNPQIIYEMAVRVEREINSICIKHIDERPQIDIENETLEEQKHREYIRTLYAKENI